MAFEHSSEAFTVTGTASVVATAAAGGPRTFIFVNNGASAIYFGGSDVSSTNGLPLAAGQSLSIPCGGALYAVSGGSVNLRRLEVV